MLSNINQRKMQNYTYSFGSKVLLWRVKIVKSRIGKLVGPFTVAHHDTRSNIVSIGQDRVI